MIKSTLGVESEPERSPERMRAITHLRREGESAIAVDQQWETDIRHFIEIDAGITDPDQVEKTFGAYRQQRDQFIGLLANNYDAVLLRYAAILESE